MKHKYAVAVCDDESIARDIVASAVSSVFSSSGLSCEIEQFSAPGDLEERMKSRIFHLLMLDTEMPDGSGLELGRRLRAEDNAVKIVFVSNRTELVFESLEINPFAFVRKNNLIGDINAAITRYIEDERNAKEKGQTLVIKKHNGIGSYRIDEITYIEGSRNAQYIHRRKKETAEVKSSLSDLEEHLRSYGFYRIHKSFIVNLACVEDIETDTVIIQGGEKLPVSRGKTPDVKLQYMKYLQENNLLIRL